MKSASLTLGLAAGLLLGTGFAPTFAKDIKVTGMADYTFTSSEQTKLPDGGTLYRFVEKAVDVEDPAGPWNLNPNQCYGFVVVSADGKSAPGAGACDGIDKDGDRWAIWWTSTDQDRWGVTYGTGKFAGMTGGGTTDTLYQDDENQVLRYTGTLTLK